MCTIAGLFNNGRPVELALARDIIGLRPLFFAHTSAGFAFASERRALEAMGYPYPFELDPRTLLRYSITEDRVRFIKRDFFPLVPEITDAKAEIKAKLLTLLRASISELIPRRSGERFAVLFSGGLDSTLIAYLCKEMMRVRDFECYTVVVEEPGMKEAEDLSYAKRIAEDLGLSLKIRKLNLEEVENYLKEVIPVIHDADGVKISVAVPLYVGCKMAKDAGIKTVLYGLGAEELFAGYEEYKRVKKEEVNRACLSGLSRMHERDLYRDYMIAKAHGISLLAPFLATDLVEYAMRIPVSLKLSDDHDLNKAEAVVATADKLILREIARDLGLEEAASRKKKAVQYGANVVKAIEKLAKRKGYRYTRDYLRTFYRSRDIKLGCLFSSGKDSAYALWLMHKAGYAVECLINIKSQNPESFMFHTPGVELVALQADAMDLPLITKETEGEKEKELEDLRAAFREAKEIHGIDGVVSGALWSNYQKERIERIACEENLKVFFPLWHINQETELRLVVSLFEIIFTGIGAYGLDRSWLGRRITVADVDRLVELSQKFGVNIAGEGGEFESLVLDGPPSLFKKKQKILIVESEIVEEGANTARLLIKKAVLISRE